MARTSESLRQQVVERAKGRCEYCQTQEVVVVNMEIDHIIPVSAGGLTHPDNLCFACAGCNGFKLDAVAAIDPQTGNEVALYHPRKDHWNHHFSWSPDAVQIVGLTAIGRATIDRLKMNREVMINARRLWHAVGWHPPKD